MKLSPIALLSSFFAISLLAPFSAAQQNPSQQNPSTTPNSQPNVFFGDKEKKVKGSTRPVHGTVKDVAGSAIPQAVVALKNLKTGKKLETVTRDDGSYRFDELKITEDYELQARRDNLTSPTKKLSLYDSRRDPVINFELGQQKTAESEARK